MAELLLFWKCSTLIWVVINACKIIGSKHVGCYYQGGLTISLYVCVVHIRGHKVCIKEHAHVVFTYMCEVRM